MIIKIRIFALNKLFAKILTNITLQTTMKLRNFFYLLLALPLLFAACNKDNNDGPANNSDEYVMDKALILGVAAPSYTDGYILLSLSDLERDFSLLINLRDVAGNQILEAGTYSVANNKLGLLGSIISYNDDRNSVLFDGDDSVVVIEGDVNNYKIDIQLTDTQKRRYHFTYDGRVGQMSPNIEIPTEPVNSTAAQLVGYSLQLPEVSQYNLYVYDRPLKENGHPQANCSYYAVCAFNIAGDVDAEGYVTIPEGTYTFDQDNTGAACTLYTQPHYVLINEDGTEYNAMTMADDGELVVTADGFTLTAIIDGVKHTITYNSVPKLKVEQAIWAE